jgi:hypothetical protein
MAALTPAPLRHSSSVRDIRDSEWPDHARCWHNWPLPCRATILGRWLAGTDRPPLCYTLLGRRVKNARCKCMFQVFQMFHKYVASVSYGCCKTRSGCCICCNGCTCMLQVSVLMFRSSVRLYLQVCLSKCCMCFTHMLHVF